CALPAYGIGYGSDLGTTDRVGHVIAMPARSADADRRMPRSRNCVQFAAVNELLRLRSGRRDRSTGITSHAMTNSMNLQLADKLLKRKILSAERYPVDTILWCLGEVLWRCHGAI